MVLRFGSKGVSFFCSPFENYSQPLGKLLTRPKFTHGRLGNYSQENQLLTGRRKFTHSRIGCSKTYSQPKKKLTKLLTGQKKADKITHSLQGCCTDAHKITHSEAGFHAITHNITPSATCLFTPLLTLAHGPALNSSAKFFCDHFCDHFFS